MASSFDRWEKDPFFSAAEEVQESADRMQSTYRTWVQAKKESFDKWNRVDLRRDLQTALGTTKWQLEEFERAVMSSYINRSTDDTKERHRDFIVAIEDQISSVQNSLEESALTGGELSPSWVHLDEGECNELASFLSGPSASVGLSAQVKKDEKHQVSRKASMAEHSKNSGEWASVDSREEKLCGHRRVASANPDIGAWNIAVGDDVCQQNSFNGHPPVPPRKIPSLSGFLNTMDSVTKFKWPKKGFRKGKSVDSDQDADSALLKSTQLDRAMNKCFDRSKSCLDSCDDSYNKNLYGWCGAIHRQIQRSQYHVQYSRPVQLTFSVILLLCLIVLITLCKI
ncbi:hypothetical protein MLD38_034485 [Melastoma candidum]|uniref:Uncharacterized protein n=1 Tax=Melastoma candidum TaxID=119954 RepID=A0ACB9MCE6_9MYRT|nr:hypothetical protein MLD38_034485 [Melastoma candidum]